MTEAAARGLVGRLATGRLHYAWVMALLGLVNTACALGIGRFAFGMLLPGMQNGLGLTYGQVGLISTSNFIGYLVGALICGRLTKVHGARRVIAGAAFLVGLSLLAVSQSSGFWAPLVLFTLTGLGSGLGNVGMVGLVVHWFRRSLRGQGSGIVVSGSGYAIMASGLIIPAVNRAFGVDGWRWGWVVLASFVIVVAVTLSVMLRGDPRDLDLEPAGTDLPPRVDGVMTERLPRAQVRRTTAHLAVIYLLFGFSYVIYVTFIVTTLVKERGWSEGAAGWFWFAVGFFSIFSGPVFGAVSDRFSRKIGLAGVFTFHLVAFSIAGLSALPNAFMYVSVVVFGVSAWSIPGIIGAMVGDYLGPMQAVQTLGLLTVFFGIGQAVGPTIAGVIADATGTFNSSYLMAAAASLLGLIGSLALRPTH